MMIEYVSDIQSRNPYVTDIDTDQGCGLGCEVSWSIKDSKLSQ